MEETINLHSRYGEKNYLKKIAETDDFVNYLLQTQDCCIREGNLNLGNKFIDPVGGPMIIEGVVLDDIGLAVVKVEYIKEHGFVITFKK